MFLNLAKLILSFFDLLDRKKILAYFKRSIKGQLKCYIDVGAHHGESIKSFNKTFKIEKIIAFEPSEKNFKILSEKNKNIKNLKIFNIGLGEKKETLNFKQHIESQSSTLVKINDQSNYYKRKNFFLNFFNKNKIQFYDVKVKVDDKDYELQGVYEFTEDVYNNFLCTPEGDLEKFLQTAPRKKLH